MSYARASSEKEEEERVREELSKKVEAIENENLAEGKLEVEDPIEKEELNEKKEEEKENSDIGKQKKKWK